MTVLWFDPFLGIQEGVWYEINAKWKWEIRVTQRNKYLIIGYGISQEGRWVDETNITTIGDIKSARKLLDNEVKNILITEKDRRGFEDCGTKYKCAQSYYQTSTGVDKHIPGNWTYVPGLNALTDGCGGYAFYKGNWGEIC